MAFELQQQLKLAQQLVMTPQLQMAIKLLQLNRLELIDAIQQELEENPTLEEAPNVDTEESTSDQAEIKPDDGDSTKEVTIEENVRDDIDWSNYMDEYNSSGKAHYEGEKKDTPSFENFIATDTSLSEHLLWQLRMMPLSDLQRKIAGLIIGNLNSDGYLKVSVDSIGTTLEISTDEVEKFLLVIQEDLDPAGVCARNLKETLLIQAKRLGFGGDVVIDIISNQMKHVENKNFKALAKALSISVSDAVSAAKIIKGFDPKPGRKFSETPPQYITPDIFLYKVENEFVIMLNDDGMPKLSLNYYYKEALRRRGKFTGEAKEYIEEKTRSAAWLIKSIQQRQKTIYKVMESILKFQKNFFEKGVEWLEPLILRDVAQDVEMHESTISRVTNSKYVHTPQGVFKLKYFFNSSINRTDGGASSSVTVQEKIRQIIKNEDPGKPYSDDKISTLLGKDNFIIARRTVAKYREAMKFLPSNKRKQF
ncbi:MAG TPA: RNA polymerase sigma-54 factor [Desulfobacteraceae bacterium]|nr:RNA polymerase sigma-54 factor [Desulfobacteraceae bacterium]